MINTKICEWLIENADAPIRYRVARELLCDDKSAKKIESELLENREVQFWLNNLKPKTPSQHWSIEHGCFDFSLENALPKIVQLGLHGGLPQVRDALEYYLKNHPGTQYRAIICRSEKTGERKTGGRSNQHSMFNYCDRD